MDGCPPKVHGDRLHDLAWEDDINAWLESNEAIQHVLGFKQHGSFGYSGFPTIEEASYSTLCLFGRNPMGTSCSVLVKNVKPWVRARIRDSFKASDVIASLSEVLRMPTLRSACKVEWKYKFFGYESEVFDSSKRKKHRVLKIECTSLKMYRNVERAIKNHMALELVDYKIPPVQKVLLDLKLSYNEVFEVDTSPGSINQSTSNRWSHCDIEIEVSRPELVRGLERGPEKAVPWTVVAIDVEAIPKDFKFPTPFDGGSKSFCISVSVWRYSKPGYDTVLLYLGDGPEAVKKPDDSTDSTVIEVYKTVHEMFEGLRDIICVRVDADLVTGFNIFGFDLPFLWSEYVLHGVKMSHRCSTVLPKTTEIDPDKYGHRAALWARLHKEIPNIVAEAVCPDVTLMTSSTTDHFETFEPCKGLFWSRFRAGRCHLVEKLMRTAARGDNIYLNLGGMHGRTIVDMMQILKDDKKPPDNSLDYASRHFLRKDRKGMAEKIDLDKHDMFAMFRKGDPADQWTIGEYCVRDSLICIWLMEDCKYLSQWIEMARASGTSMEDICNSGQQRKVFNSILLMLNNRLPLKSVLNSSNANALELEDMPEYGFVINDADSGWPAIEEPDSSSDSDANPVGRPKKKSSARKRTADYQGATVLEPEAGFYERPVGSLDFNSLYPSIIRDQNLCFSTIVLEDDEKDRIRADKVPHEEYEITHVKADGSTFTKTYMFVKHIGGVLPKVLAFQLQLRKQIRKLEKAETDSFLKSVYNGQQLAVKVLMNSLYGFTGASSGILGCKPIAAVVTLRGRAMIELAKTTVENLIKGSRVLYGDTDSIMVLWPEIDERTCTLKEAWDFGETAAAEITSKFSMVVKIELEAVKWPFLLLGKKKYAAIQYEAADGHGEPILRGLEPVRRDFTGLVKKTYKQCLDALLLERSTDKARESLVSAVVNVLDDSMPLEDFIITKQLNAEYADANSVPQYRAWQRMQDRGDLNAPVVGMRMPYIVTATGTKATAQCERTEHPDYVIRAKVPIDKEYYLTSLLRPIGDLLDSTDINVKKIIDRAIEVSEEIAGISLHGATWAKAGFKITKTKDSIMEKFRDLAGKSRKRDRTGSTKKTVSLLDFIRK